jgi:hypothetical protein
MEYISGLSRYFRNTKQGNGSDLLLVKRYFISLTENIDIVKRFLL